MKKITLIITAILFLSIANLKAQEIPEYKYSFINEYGFFLGSGNTFTTVGLTGVFINGLTVNNTFFMGVGLGYESDNESGQSIPMFLNFRYLGGGATGTGDPDFPGDGYVKNWLHFFNVSAGFVLKL